MSTMAKHSLFGLAENRTDVWATPQDLFNKLNTIFNFDLDVCALPENAKCERYFTPEIDGLLQQWIGTCWINPPYGSEIKYWIAKAAEAAKQGHTVVALVPSRTDVGWWQEHCMNREIHYIKGRLKFGGCKHNAPFGCAVVVFRPSLNDVKWEPS